jgi:hypothetical protein
MMAKVILSLQISGFVVAVILLCITAAPHWLFVVSFGVHLVGDLLFLSVEGLPKMAFNIDNYIKIAPWLQFVGLALAVGGLLAHAHWVGVPMAYVGIFVSFAGFIYDKIYP